MLKSIFSWLLGDAGQITINTVAGCLFLLLIPIALVTGLKGSVPFVVFLSLWALVASHWSAVLAALAAKRSEAAATASANTADSAQDTVEDLRENQSAA